MCKSLWMCLSVASLGSMGSAFPGYKKESTVLSFDGHENLCCGPHLKRPRKTLPMRTTNISFY